MMELTDLDNYSFKQPPEICPIMRNVGSCNSVIESQRVPIPDVTNHKLD